MRLKDWAFLLGGVSAAMLVYGSLYEAQRLVLERRTLRLPGWPESKAGFRIAVLADLHLRFPMSLKVAKRAVAMALAEEPDMVVIAGDLLDRWHPEALDQIQDCLAPLTQMSGSVLAIPGNHDYYNDGDPEFFRTTLEGLGIRLLRNEIWVQDGISWVGLDSAVMEMARPSVLNSAEHQPAIVLWHEADLVEQLPPGAVLQISGHSHGGQFRFPGGITPMYAHLGKRYPEGFYPDAPTPVYVSRGVGTTGPPSRFLCPPEVSLLTLVPG